MILDRLADATRARYARRMADTPLDIVKSRALALPKGNFAFERALEAPGVSLICEVKRPAPPRASSARTSPTWTLPGTTQPPELLPSVA